MRHVAIVTEARSSFSYFRPIVRLIEDDDSMTHSLLVVSQHLLPAFGYTVEEIEREGLDISDRLYSVFDGYTPATMAKSTGALMMSLTDSFVRLRPDWVLVLGDRGESLAAAYTAATMNIPVAHVQAGERSGNVDGMTRHAITRFAHLHFASGEEAAERLRRMGEEEWRIATVGAPQLDELLRRSFADPEQIAAQFEIDLDRPLLLVLQHPVTEDFGEGADQMQATLEAVCELGEQTILVFPNSDAGSEDIRRVIGQYRRPFIRVERNLPHHAYAGLMNVATAMVGNSSSGIIEAPLMGLPAVNVGDRQRERARASNVIDVPHKREAIVDALRRAMSLEFRAQMSTDSPYVGDGQVSERILEILRTTTIDHKLMTKQIVY
ncbi:UDP-N-acetylglucosamine 2-epimerase [Actinomycetospora aeridis]|uniref:UDP-N-acetylglucosamine 2-epimerase n=1 Tax=Actinomycetospora aeridis TaxID=3129231 RepID=A0ABU8N689_9PSEU